MRRAGPDVGGNDLEGDATEGAGSSVAKSNGDVPIKDNAPNFPVENLDKKLDEEMVDDEKRDVDRYMAAGHSEMNAGENECSSGMVSVAGDTKSLLDTVPKKDQESADTVPNIKEAVESESGDILPDMGENVTANEIMNVETDGEITKGDESIKDIDSQVIKSEACVGMSNNEIVDCITPIEVDEKSVACDFDQSLSSKPDVSLGGADKGSKTPSPDWPSSKQFLEIGKYTQSSEKDDVMLPTGVGWSPVPQQQEEESNHPLLKDECHILGKRRPRQREIQ